MFSNLLHNIICALPNSKLRCVQYAHTVKKKMWYGNTARVCRVLKQHTWQLLKQNFKDLAPLKSHQAGPHPLPLLATASLGARAHVTTCNHFRVFGSIPQGYRGSMCQVRTARQAGWGAGGWVGGGQQDLYPISSHGRISKNKAGICVQSSFLSISPALIG